MGNNTPIPDGAALSDFSKAAADTARSHLQAAKCLLDGKCWGQARSIAVIAFEEAGKAWLSTIAMLAPDELRQEFPWRALGWDHLGKLHAARSLHAFLVLLRGGTNAPPSMAEAWAGLEALARDDNAAKQDGLYTDYADGHVRSPAGITEEQARAMVAVVEDVLDNAGPLIDVATGLWARDNMPPSVLSFLQRAVDAAQASSDAMEHFVQDELRAMDVLAGLLADDPEWMRGILAVALPESPGASGQVSTPSNGEEP
jgi:AbiV family abortive infection protein